MKKWDMASLTPIFSLILTALQAINCFGQSQFQLAIGGTFYNYASSIVHSTDGGYAVAGNTNTFGVGITNVYIIKLSSSGSIQWSKTVGGTGADYASSIVHTTDGGYVAAGGTNSFGAGDYDMFIVKLSSNGSIQWSKTVGGTNYDLATSIIQTTDGGYAVAGYTYSFGAGFCDMYIVKLGLNGALQWSKTVGGTNWNASSCIIQTTEGGFAVAGTTNSFGGGGDDMYIVKLDSYGSLQWTKTIGGTDDDWANCIIQTTDGGYTVAGWTQSFGAGGKDLYIVKLSSNGSLQWSKTVGGTGDDEAYSIIQTTDGGYTVAGCTSSFGAGVYDMYIVKLSSTGSLQWSKTVGGTGDDEANSIIQTADGGYAVAGCTSSFGAGNSDMYIVKLDANGNTCGNSTSPSSISGTGGTETSPSSTITTPTSIVTTSSPSVSSGGTINSICVIGIKPISTEIPNSFSLYQNYPNPFNPTTKIKFSIPLLRGVDAPNTRGGRGVLTTLKIYDILGKQIATLVNEKQNAGSYEVTWEASNFPSGVYFYKLIVADHETKDAETSSAQGSGFIQTKRMVLVK